VAVRRFWPAADAAQIDYETLRAATLAGVETSSVAAARFARRGLAGLIAWPSAEPVFAATIVGAVRPRWSPHSDPRVDTLAAGFELLLAAASGSVILKEAQR
jgi:hypothetical protein